MNDPQRQELLEAMKRAILFRYLDDDMLDGVLQSSEVLHLESEHKIIEQGEVDPHLYVILDGSVSVTVRESSAPDVYVNTVGEGEVLGEAGVFTKSPRTASITTMVDSTLLKLHRQAFVGFMKKRPDAGVKMLMIIIFGLLKKLRERPRWIRAISIL